MSRIGSKPISVPSGVTIEVDPANVVKVKGPKGELTVSVDRRIRINRADSTLTMARDGSDRVSRSQHGLARTLVNNCVEGVTKGHSKTLELQGVGYRVQLQGKDLLFNIGYSHQVSIKAQQGIIFEVVIDEKARTQRVVVSGIDKAKVGQMAADIRKVRKPDPYKGKGIRYLGEIVKTRAGKRAAAVVKAK